MPPLATSPLALANAWDVDFVYIRRKVNMTLDYMTKLELHPSAPPSGVVVADGEPSAAPIADVVAVARPVSGGEPSSAPTPAPTPAPTTKV
ncbi:hypothetical protein V6N11_046443 [Hibiscus sabdariffa]|uniref:Uncharacterized protein n=1 Tax=Hibiscus sabdariffa TaxID=183260 RepID=A0ABR2P279_9ROSI